MSTTLPFRPPRGRQSSVSFNPPRPVYQDQNTPPRSQLCSRTFSVKLPSLRERSNETNNSEVAPLKPLPADFNNWTGTWQGYIASKNTQVVEKEVEVDPHIVELQKRCAERLDEKGGDLTLDIFKPHEKDSSGDHLRQVSSCSSAYGEYGSLSPPHAPGSPPHHGTMNLRDLEKYSRANDRLSNLRSSTNSGGSGGDSVHGAAEDAAEVAQGWETVLSTRPKKHPFVGGKDEKPIFFAHEWKGENFYTSPQNTEFGRTYDGTYSPKKRTAQNSTDTSSSTEPTNFTNPSNKRKASVFSLRSIQHSISAKRPRLNIRKLATSVSSHLSEAKRRIEQHNATNRRNFEA